MTAQRWVRAIVLAFLLVWNGGFGLLMGTAGPPLIRRALGLAPPYLALGFVMCLALYFGGRRFLLTPLSRRLLCAGILLLGFCAYGVALSASAFDLRVMVVAGSLWGGAVFGVVTVVPLWTSRAPQAIPGSPLPPPKSLC